MQTLAVQAVFTAGFFTAYTAAAGNLVPPPTAGFWIAVAWAVAGGHRQLRHLLPRHHP